MDIFSSSSVLPLYIVLVFRYNENQLQMLPQVFCPVARKPAQAPKAFLVILSRAHYLQSNIQTRKICVAALRYKTILFLQYRDDTVT